MKINDKEMVYNRLSVKNLNQQFMKRIENGMGCSPFVSEAIVNVVQEIYSPFLNTSENFSPGKMNFQCVSKNVGATTKISEAELVIVTLTLDIGKSDLEIRKKHNIAKLRQERIIRMCTEAFNQGGLLTVEDLAYRILNVGYRTVIGDLADIRKDGENPPLRSTVKDMGRTVSHKTIIIKNWLKGDELSELKRKYNHSLSAIENYVNTFKRVIFLEHEGKPMEQIAYLLKISIPLAQSYLELWEKHSSSAIPHRKDEVLDIIGSKDESKKKKKRRKV